MVGETVLTPEDPPYVAYWPSKVLESNVDALRPVVAENVCFTGKRWIEAICQRARMAQIAPRIAEALADLDHCSAEAFNGQLNVEDIFSLVK